MFLVRVVLAVLLIATVPMALFCDPTMFWELGPVETGDLIVLLVGSVLSSYWYITDDKRHSRFRNIWGIGGLLFFIATAREASWGRIFIADGIGPEGPIIPSMKSLWFGPFINVGIGIILLVLLVVMLRNRRLIVEFGRYVLSNKTALTYIVLFVVLLGVADLVFDRNIIFALNPWHQGFEEMIELAAYWSAVGFAVAAREKA